MSTITIECLACLLVFAAIGSARAEQDAAAGVAGRAEPPFPLLLDSVSQPRVHIVSESFDANYGQETIEEFVDLSKGKAVFTSSSREGHKTTLVDGTSKSIYRYRPYTCLTLKPAELIGFGETGIWSKVLKFYANDGSQRIKSELHLYEVAAAWLNAGQLVKSYSRSKAIYSPGKDEFLAAHKWTVDMGGQTEGLLVHFYFTVDSINSRPDSLLSGPQLSLQVIQEELHGKVTRTVNILSIDYQIGSDIYETLMQVPLGYGCKPDERPAEFEQKQQIISASQELDRHNRFRAEVTATKFNNANNANKQQQQQAESDTLSLDLLVDRFAEFTEGAQMIRQRNSKKDVKRVVDHELRVMWSIDLRRGSCSISHLDDKPTGNTKLDKFSIEFDNGLRMDFDELTSRELFDWSPSCQVIKVTKAAGGGGGSKSNAAEFVHLECELSGQSSAAFQRMSVRLMKKYSLTRKSEQADQVARLESVTVWVLDDSLSPSTILESYHFHIVESDFVSDRNQLARLYDVSEECYVMAAANGAEQQPQSASAVRYGRDFAWFELTYPVAGHQLDALAANAHALKDTISRRLGLLSGHLMRLPRIELMFGESELIVRCLMLDFPSIIHMYDQYPERRLLNEVKAADKQQQQQQQGQLFAETTVDAEHCADLCRLHRCKAMSYCASSFNCLLRVEELQVDSLDSELKRDSSCITYASRRRRHSSSSSSGGAGAENNNTRPQVDIFEQSLAFLMNRLRDESFADLRLPRMPDEMLYPISETGLSEAELRQVESNYVISVYKALEEQDELVPSLAIMLTIDGRLVFLIPSKFALDADPLADIRPIGGLGSLGDTTIDDDDDGDHDHDEDARSRVAAFHEGLALHRYKLSGFRDSAATNDARQYLGLTYDQCALACADGRCSSFSYCKHRQDCLITNVYDLQSALSANQIVPDSDCFIAQRDFLQKFNQFPNVYRPSVYQRSGPALSPSECAHSCVVESQFNCLAFDYCQSISSKEGASGGGGGGQCYYLDSRIIYTGRRAAGNETAAAASKGKQPPAAAAAETGCSHYSRSYLADFVRIAYRRVESSHLSALRTSLIEGHSVDRCAESCLNDAGDCTAFQFCFEADSTQRPKQRCTLIESQLTADGGSQDDLRIVQDLEGNVVEQGKFFALSSDCHVFALRRDSSEAQMRDVALKPLTPSQARQQASQSAAGGGPGGLTLGGAFMLYLGSMLAFAALGCGLVVAKHRSPYLSDKFDRFKALLGYY